MAKTAEQAQADTSLLSRRIFASPPPHRLILPIAGVSLLGATVVAASNPQWEAVARAFRALALPIYGSAVLTLPIAKAFGGHTYLRRTTLQAFVDALTVFAFVAFVGLAELVWWLAHGSTFPYAPQTLLILGFSATSWLRHVIWIATSHHSHLRTLRAAALALRAPERIVALLVATHAHPGPFGRVGGSDLPAKLRAALGDVSPVVMVPHGPSTHDYNPSTSNEVMKIAATVRSLLGSA